MVYAAVVPAFVVSAVAVSAVMTAVLHRVRQFAQARTPVVFVGETGTGKTFLARLLHELSGRPGRFADVTAGEIEGDLAPDDLFGHVRGSFTGALGRRVGLLGEASDGTLLFDDFHLLSQAGQARLLRAFDRGVYRPLGVDRDVPVTCRLVVGVQRDLDALVAEGTLLADLRYRLEHCVIVLPPLAQRREEIAPFARLFLAECPAATGVDDGPRRFARGVMPVLEAGTYPGNLRDLRGRIRAAYLMARGSEEIELEHLPPNATGAPLRFEPRADHATQLQVVRWALWRTGDNMSQAAELIGAHRNTVAALRAELRRREVEGRSQSAEG